MQLLTPLVLVMTALIPASASLAPRTFDMAVRALANSTSTGGAAGVVPAACNGTCSSTISLYDACEGGSETTCEQICSDAQFATFVGCFNCVLANVTDLTEAEYEVLAYDVELVRTGCQEFGLTVNATTSLTPYTALTNTAPSGVTTGDAAGLTQLASGLGATLTASGSGASTTSGASAAATSSASASIGLGTSGADKTVARPLGVIVAALALGLAVV
ncbi:hypothetical protein Q5752_004937 [Cryptotrichosporon argae]